MTESTKRELLREIRHNIGEYMGYAESAEILGRIDTLLAQPEKAVPENEELRAWRKHGETYGFSAGKFFEDGDTYIIQHDDSIRPEGAATLPDTPQPATQRSDESDEVKLARQLVSDYAKDNVAKSRILRPGRTVELQLAEAVVKLSDQVERMLDVEQERLLLTSEDEIRKEILADGRDPDEYLRAIDSAIKSATELAFLRSETAPSGTAKVPEAMRAGFLLRLFDDIQNNAAIGEPAWSGISDRIWQVRSALATVPEQPSAKEKGNETR